MIGHAIGAGIRGVEAVLVRVEVDLGGGLPSFHIVGLPGGAVRESRLRVKSAIENAGFDVLSAQRATANLAPADVPKDGTGYDLPLALALLEAGKVIPAGATRGRLFAGELSLSGDLKPVRGALPIADAARAHRLSVVVPEANAQEAAVVPGLEVCTARNLVEVVEFLRQEGELRRVAPVDYVPEGPEGPDLADVAAQAHARRALEISAAGRHNLLLVGPPGSGKTMLARRLPSLLPPLTLDEAVETTRIHSVAGLTRRDGLLRRRPFRAPHHTASQAALVGGGMGPRPGEVSLAHNGVLFLDEFPEFQRAALEALRQPLEDRLVSVARARGTITFPASFQLVAAMNPCPCGHGGPDCRCSAPDQQRYQARLSGPLLDRIDLMVDVPRIPLRSLADPKATESSDAVRARIDRAIVVQRARYEKSGIRVNAEMRPAELRRFAVLDRHAQDLLLTVGERRAFSARVYTRLLRVARTIADLEGDQNIARSHLSEALLYRCLDGTH